MKSVEVVSLLLSGFVIFATFQAFGNVAQTYSLDTCYQLALKRSASLVGQLEQINQAEEKINQARAGFLPVITLTSNVTQQGVPSNPLLQSIFSSTQTTVQGVLKYNLFNGLKDLSTYQQRGLEKESAVAAKEQAKVQLYQDTVQAFYNVLAGEQQRKNFSDEIQANRERLKELRTRLKVAQARETDIATVDSALANLEASLSGSQGVLDSARETLAFLTGLPANMIIRDDTADVPQDIGPVEQWLDHSRERPDIVQAKFSVDASEKSVRSAWSGHLPSLDLLADYYVQRPGIFQGIMWDVQATISLPIFSGGLIQSQVGEALAKRRASDAALDQTQRVADREIRALYKSIKAEIEQVGLLARATDLSKRNYDLLLKDNRKGIATNLDVLQSLANAESIKRARDQAKYALKSDYSRLFVISGSKKL